MTAQRAKDALYALKSKDGNKFGVYLHTRHKDTILEALELYIKTVDNEKLTR